MKQTAARSVLFAFVKIAGDSLGAVSTDEHFGSASTETQACARSWSKKVNKYPRILKRGREKASKAASVTPKGLIKQQDVYFRFIQVIL